MTGNRVYEREGHRTRFFLRISGADGGRRRRRDGRRRRVGGGQPCRRKPFTHGTHARHGRNEVRRHRT